MKFKSAIAPLALLVGSAVTADIQASTQLTSSQPIVMGYWSNWGIYSPERPYPMSGSMDNAGRMIDNPDLNAQLDHLNVIQYAFFEAKDNGSLYFYDPWADLAATDAGFCQANLTICQDQVPTYGRGNFSAFVNQKAKHSNLRVSISVGGWDHNATFEKGAFAHQDTFVKSLKAIVDHYHIDGVDLDYEPWNLDGYNATNSKQMVELAKAIKQAMPNLMITMAVPANPAQIMAFDDGAHHNWQEIAKYVSYFGIMAYDMHGGFDNPKITAHHASIYQEGEEPSDPAFPHFSGDQAVKTYNSVGVGSEQLILGLPAYARFVGGVGSTNNGLYQPFTSVPDGDFGEGMESYYTIKTQWLKTADFSEYTTMQNGVVNASWAYSPSKQYFVSYDNPAVIDSKIQYAKSNHLAGLMVWELKGDAPAADSLVARMAKGLWGN